MSKKGIAGGSSHQLWRSGTFPFICRRSLPVRWLSDGLLNGPVVGIAAAESGIQQLSPGNMPELVEAVVRGVAAGGLPARVSHHLVGEVFLNPTA